MAKVNSKKLGTWAIVISLILSVLTFLATIAGVSNSLKTTETVNTMQYVRGNVNEDGKVIQSNEALVLQEAITVDGLTITIEDEATISYKVAFYGEDGEYLSTTEAIETDFDVSLIPEGAKTCRVIIKPYPIDGEAVKLNVFNISKYANQLEITTNKVK